jgi:cell division septal protein FtsQ
MIAPTEDRPRVARPPIDPRIRDRRIEVIREAGRRRLRVTLVVASAIVVIGLAYLTVRSPLLDVDHVQIAGAQRESVTAIRDAAGVRNGDALLFVNTGAIAKRVERLPWVEHATVRRDFPGTVAIAVTEFAPTMFVHTTSAKVALIGSSGRVIAFADSAPPGAVLAIGVKSKPKVGAELLPPEAADAIRMLPPRLARQVQAIDFGGTSPALELPGRAAKSDVCKPQRGGVASNPQIRLGNFDAMRDKGNAALAVLDHQSSGSGPVPFTYVDVSVPQSPVSC